jgi:biotin-(acetyl-CoA carboxylase) ligase
VLDPLDVAASVLEEIAKLYSVWAVPEVTFANFVAEFNSLLAFAEYDVKVCLDDGSEVARGRLRGVDAQGCLMVGDAKVTSGSMSLV